MKLLSLVFLFLGLLTLTIADIVFYKDNPQPTVKTSVKGTPAAATPTPPANNQPLMVKGSIPYWDQKNAFATFEKNIKVFSHVSLFWYFLGNDGKIHKYAYANEDKSIIDFAHENNVKVEVVITNLPENGGWDSARVEKVLSDDESRGRLIIEIVNLADRLGIEGVDIDFEQLDQNLAGEFSAFINELGSALDKTDKYLGVALHPKTEDGIGVGNGSRAQDWRKISEGADNMYIMAFGEHWDEGEAGPIASLPWVERIVKYAQSLGIEEGKLFLTIPLYGYAWQHDSDGDARGLTYKDGLRLLKKYAATSEWDEAAKSAHFHYEDDGDWEVWFENARSVEEKINLAKNAGFGGISFWRLGGEDPQIWELPLGG